MWDRLVFKRYIFLLFCSPVWQNQKEFLQANVEIIVAIGSLFVLIETLSSN